MSEKAVRVRRATQSRPTTIRPSLSPALIALAGVWTSVYFAVEVVLNGHFSDTSGGVSTRIALGACAGVVIALLGIAILCKRIRPFVGIACASLCIGLAAGIVFARSTLACAESIVSKAASRYEFVIETDPKLSSSGNWTFQAIAYESGSGSAAGSVWVSASERAFFEANAGMGSRITVVGRWSAFDDDEWGRSMLGRGFCARLSVSRIHVMGSQGGPVGAIRALRAEALRVVDSAGGNSPGVALACGVVLGQTSGLDQLKVSDDFKHLGLTHLVAVSGSHLAVVAGLLGILLRSANARPWLRCIVVLAGLGSYVILSGVQPSALRSFVMVGICSLASLTNRSSHAISALSVAALCLVLISPGISFQMGFLLSVLSVVGIACFSRYASAWISCILPARVPKALSDAIGLTVVAQAFTLPVTLPAFGILPVLSPLANIVIGPLMSAQLVCGMACIALALAFPLGAGVFLAPCAALGQLICLVSTALSSVPYAAIPMSVSAGFAGAALAAGGLAVYVAWPQPSARTATALGIVCLCAAGLVFMRMRFVAPDRLVMLDIGQGDAILIQSASHSVLVDTGPDDAIVAALGRQGVIHLDAVILTHTDLDHVGGLDSLAGLVQVDSIVFAEGVSDALALGYPDLARTVSSVASNVREVSAGDVLEWGRVTMEVVWPRVPVDGDENADSIVALASFSEGGSKVLKALLTGDAEKDTLGMLTSSNAIGDIDVLKVGHHGSADSIATEELASLCPELAIASAGESNRYGHPTRACRETLMESRVPLLCTIWSGDIELHATSFGYDVSCQKGSVAEGVGKAYDMDG